MHIIFLFFNFLDEKICTNTISVSTIFDCTVLQKKNCIKFVMMKYAKYIFMVLLFRSHDKTEIDFKI